jgi:antitoxin (DNA-binding transcriptional repressor) of toxin-antitoxin stability system
MKRYTTATAKQRFSLLLDAAERGEPVIIERRGVRFRIQTDRRSSRKRPPRYPVIEIVDPAVGVSKEADTLNSGNRLLISSISARERIYHSTGALRFFKYFCGVDD